MTTTCLILIPKSVQSNSVDLFPCANVLRRKLVAVRLPQAEFLGGARVRPAQSPSGRIRSWQKSLPSWQRRTPPNCVG